METVATPMWVVGARALEGGPKEDSSGDAGS